MLVLKQLRFASGNRTVIFVDSQAAVWAFTSLEVSISVDVWQGREMMAELLHTGWTMMLQWNPSHSGVWSNERADRLAKEGSKKLQPQAPLEFSTVKKIITEQGEGKGKQKTCDQC